MAAPRRPPGRYLRRRWFSNLAILVLSLVLIRSLFPLLGVGMAILAAERGIGLLNIVHLPTALAWVITLLVLDLGRYIEHLALHRVPLLWRVHRTHHTDMDFDVTVGFRFHPIESVLFTCWPLGVIALLGLPASGVVMWQVALLINSVFSHANVRMAGSLDRVIRLVAVTPDMHRVHHSTDARESESNLGSLFPWWDRLFGTYVTLPASKLETMPIGVAALQDPKYLSLHWMLALPFLPDRLTAPRNRESLQATQPPV